MTRISDSKRNELRGRNIEKMRDIPSDIALSESQSIQVEVEKTKEPHVDRDKIRRHLDGLCYPLWFLDFETYGFAIPEYDGTRSYQQLPFQFSLHVMEAPGANLQHVEFLHMENSDPRRFLSEKMIQGIGDVGSVLVYYAPFEKTRLKELAETFVDLRPKIESLITRIWDLEVPFSKKWYYDSRFEGSSSIKKVLPVLAPASTYEGLGIAKGDIAQAKYLEAIRMDPKSTARAEIQKDLLAYCKHDTLAMVKILQFLLGLGSQ